MEKDSQKQNNILLNRNAMLFSVPEFVQKVKVHNKFIRTTRDGTKLLVLKCNCEDMAKFLDVESEEILEKFMDNSGQLATSPYVSIWVDKSCGDINEKTLTVENKPTILVYIPARYNYKGRSYFTMIAEERIVNVRYIGIVKEINNYLKYEEIDILPNDILIRKIEAMVENNNGSILDIQTLFTKSYPSKTFQDKTYDYLYPKEYTDSYVNKAIYPNLLTQEEYRRKEEEYRQEVKEKYQPQIEAAVKEEMKSFYKNLYPKENTNSHIVEQSITQEEYKRKEEEYRQEVKEKYQPQIEAAVKEEMKSFYKEQCEKFTNEARSFIFAHTYITKLQDIKNDTCVKMYSTDQIGWKNFEYKINGDITIYINTNFGYGNASYFFCNLQYKGISINPYSWIVKYYFVKMIDFVRYTRMFLIKRTSWSEVFDFTVLTVNMAKHDPDKFIKEWIVNEVEEMLKGMRNYMSNAKEAVEEFLSGNFSIKDKSQYGHITFNSDKPDHPYRDIIRNSKKIDKEDYMAYPQEKTIIFKAEKITGCLLLLNNLLKLTEIATVIKSYILEIEEMNVKLKPEIEIHMNNIATDIKNLNTTLHEVIKELEPLKPLFDAHKKAIEDLIPTEIKNDAKKRYEISKSVEEMYEKKHPEYIELKEKFEKQKELENDIKRRKNFYNILVECKNRINKYLDKNALT